MFRGSVIVLVIMFYVKTYAQQFNFKNLNVEHGLPSSEVYYILQDSKGYIWGATDAGVFKYNGSTFKIYTTKEGIPDNTVFNLSEDKHGRIWMFGYNGKIGYIRDDSAYIMPCSEKLSNSLLKGKRATGHIYIDNTDVVWVATAWSLFKALPSDGYRSLIEIKAPNDSVNTLVVQVDTTIISSKVHFDRPAIKQTGQKKGYFFASLNVKGFSKTIKIINNNTLTTIPKHWHLKLSDGRILLSYLNDLYIIWPNGQVEIKKLKESIIALYKDKENTVWIGLSKFGGIGYKHADFDSEPLELNLNCSITGFLEDHEHGFWLSTLENGIYYAPNKGVLIFSNIAELNDKIIETATVKDTVWIVTKNSDFFYSSAGSKVNYVKSWYNPYASDLFNIHSYQDKRYVTGFLAGEVVGMFDTVQPIRVKEIPVSAGDMTADANSDSLYVCSHLEMYRVLNNKVIEKYDLPSRGRSILQTTDKRLFVGTLLGLYEFKNAGFFMVEPNDPRLRTRIMDMVAYNDYIILCTKGEGLLIKDIHNKWIQLNASSGLSSDICISATIFNNEMWVATIKGVCRIRFTNFPATYDIENYNSTNGLPSDEVTKISCRNNEIWIATRRGLALLDLNKPIFNRIAPQTHIAKIWVNENPAALNNGAVLPYDHNNLKLYIEVPSFKSNGKINFIYKLEGNDDRFRGGASNILEYQNLPPGSYTLQIFGINNNGIKTKEPVKLSFSIEKPFWIKSWFILLGGMTLISMLFFIMKWRSTKIRKEEEKKTKINKELAEYQMTALQAQMNPHFIFNAINSIQRYILQKNHKEAYTYLTKFSHLIRRVLNNAHDKNISLRNEIETLKLYLELEQLRFADSFEVDIQVEKSLDAEQIIIPGMLIQPFVENAIWHGIMPLENLRKGYIKIKIDLINDNVLYILIEDNGIGRKKSDTIRKTLDHKSLGMMLTKQRLELINKNSGNTLTHTSTTDLEDETGGPRGTRVELWIEKISF